MRVFFKKCTIASLLGAFLFLTMMVPSLAGKALISCPDGTERCGCVCYKPEPLYPCAGVCYSLCSPQGDVFQQCCQGLDVCPCNEGDRLCGGIHCYDPETSGCCGGSIPYSKKWEGCCDGTSYLLSYETCCENRIVPKEACCCNKIIDPKTQGCCNGVIYDLSTQACCNGKVKAGISAVRLIPTAKANKSNKCCKRNPSCFYAIVDDSPEPFFPQSCEAGEMIVFPNAICPDANVQVYQLDRCGPSQPIKGCLTKGFILEGVCPW